jgi:4-hydroxybenzoate polyprenyltransferase
MYSLRILPKSWTDVIKFGRIRDLPGSKDVSTAIGWALSAAVLPFIAEKGTMSAGAAMVFVFCFLLALARSVLLGVREVHRDRMIGKETFFNVLGRAGTKVLLGIVVALLIGALMVHWRLTGNQLSLIMLTVAAYACLYCISYHYRMLPEGPVGEAIVDGQFLLAGMISLAWVHWLGA